MRKIAAAFVFRCRVTCVTDKETINVRNSFHPNNGLARCEPVKSTLAQGHLGSGSGIVMSALPGHFITRRRSNIIFYSTEELIHA